MDPYLSHNDIVRASSVPILGGLHLLHESRIQRQILQREKSRRGPILIRVANEEGCRWVQTTCLVDKHDQREEAMPTIQDHHWLVQELSRLRQFTSITRTTAWVTRHTTVAASRLLKRDMLEDVACTLKLRIETHVPVNGTGRPFWAGCDVRIEVVVIE